MSTSLILASASPRRRELLARVGIRATVIPADIDESVHKGEAVLDYVCRVAAAKAHVVAADHPGRWVLAADTIVEQAGEALGKPGTQAEAEAMLRRLRGAEHRVTTAMALQRDEVCHNQAVTTVVQMRDFADAELAAYVAGGEWRGKAGGYAVQGMAASFVCEVRGSISNVIGLPLAEIVVLLARLGVADATYPAENAS